MTWRKTPPRAFVQHEIAQGLIFGNMIALLPKSVTGGRCDAAYDDIANLAFGMAGNRVDGFGTAHWCLAVGFGQDGGGSSGETRAQTAMIAED